MNDKGAKIHASSRFFTQAIQCHDLFIRLAVLALTLHINDVLPRFFFIMQTKVSKLL